VVKPALILMMDWFKIYMEEEKCQTYENKVNDFVESEETFLSSLNTCNWCVSEGAVHAGQRRSSKLLGCLLQ